MFKPVLYLSCFSLLISCADTKPTNSETLLASTNDSLKIENPIVEEEISKAPEYVEFPSLDGLPISATVYEISPEAYTILLCHQAGYNMHEYDEIAPRLNDLGAVQQSVPAIDAETALFACSRARRLKRPVVAGGSSPAAEPQGIRRRFHDNCW